MGTTTDTATVATSPAPAREREIGELHTAIMGVLWKCSALMDREADWSESRGEYPSDTWTDLHIVHGMLSNAGSVARIVGTLSRDPERHTGIPKTRLSGD